MFVLLFISLRLVESVYAIRLYMGNDIALHQYMLGLVAHHFTYATHAFIFIRILCDVKDNAIVVVGVDVCCCWQAQRALMHIAI